MSVWFASVVTLHATKDGDAMGTEPPTPMTTDGRAYAICQLASLTRPVPDVGDYTLAMCWHYIQQSRGLKGAFRGAVRAPAVSRAMASSR